MVIVFVTDEYPPARCGGIGTYTAIVAQALAALGYVVHVITKSSDGLVNERLSSGVYVHEIPPVYSNSLWHKLLQYVGAYRKFPIFSHWLAWANAVRCEVSRIQRHMPIDIIEVPDFHAQGILLMLMHRRNTIVRLHNPASIVYVDNGIEISTDLAMAMALEQIAVKCATMVTSPSLAMAQRLRQQWKMEYKHLRIIPCPIDDELFVPLRDWGCESRHTILYVGRLSEAKGVRCFINAAALVHLQFPDVEYVLVGDEASHPEIDDISYAEYIARTAPDLSGRVRFISPVARSDLPRFYQNAYLCVVPSIGFESFSYTSLEAMACGCPLIASKTGAISEIVIDGITGVLVLPNDHVALSNAIKWLLADQGYCLKLETSAIQHVKNNYRLEEVIKRQLEVYKDVVEKRK